MEKSTVNERLVKISASAIITPEELHIGEEVSLLVKGSVVKIEDRDNQDGTINRVFVIKGELGESISVW